MDPAPKRLRVIVTRAAGQIEPLSRRIEALGHEVVRCPLIELEPAGPERIDVGGHDWVIVTSPYGARELMRRSEGELPQVAAIGPGTAAALLEHGVTAAPLPPASAEERAAAPPPPPARPRPFLG